MPSQVRALMGLSRRRLFHTVLDTAADGGLGGGGGATQARAGALLKQLGQADGLRRRAHAEEEVYEAVGGVAREWLLAGAQQSPLHLDSACVCHSLDAV